MREPPDPVPFQPFMCAYGCHSLKSRHERGGWREYTQHTFGNIAALKLDISTMLQLLRADSDLGGVWTDDGLGCIGSCGDVSELSMHFFEREELKIRLSADGKRARQKRTTTPK